MKPIYLALGVFLALCPLAHAQSVAPTIVSYTNGVADSSQSTRGDHTRTARSRKSSATLVGKHLPSAPFHASSPVPAPPTGEIAISGATAVAAYAPHKVVFQSSLSEDNAVDLHMIDGLQLHTHIVGLAYITVTNGGYQNVLLAAIQPCQGQVLSGTQVIYKNAFAGLAADVLYEYTDHAFSQSVILHQRPPPPHTFGFSDRETQLAVITSFGSATPPRLVPSQIDLATASLASATNAPASLPDTDIQWPTMHIARGHAFSYPVGESSVPVLKMVQTLTDAATGTATTYLVEAVPYRLVKSELDQLTAAAAPGRRQTIEQALTQPTPATARSGSRQPPPPFQTAGTPKPGNSATQHLASLQPAEDPGLVLDYIIVSSAILDIGLDNNDGDRSGFAAVGYSANDFWSGYGTFGPGNPGWWTTYWSGSGGALTSYSRVAVSVNSDSQGFNGIASDLMYGYFLYASDSNNIVVTITNLLTSGSADNYYNVYVYGHGGASGNDENTVVSLSTYLNPAAPVSYGTRGTTIWGNGWNSTNWEAGQQYVRFQNVDVKRNSTNSAAFSAIQLTIKPNIYGITEVAGVQIVPSSAVSNATNPVASLLNVNFAAYSSNKLGLAAIGGGTNDFWNGYHHPGVSSLVTVTNLLWSDSNACPVTMTVSNAPGEWNNGVADGMYSGYSYAYGTPVTITFTNLANGTYDFFVYGHSPVNDPGSVFTLKTGTNTFATKGTTIWDGSWNSTNWDEGMQYIAYRRVPVVSNQLITLTVLPDDAGYSIINGVQINLAASSTTTDSNGDGIPDWWCWQYGLNPHAAGLATTTAPDGLTYLLNYTQGRNPIAGGVTDTSNLIGFNVFTPLQ